MSLYLKQIEQLVSLQEIDNEILTLKAELEGAPMEVERLEGRHEELAGQQALVQEKVDHLKGQESRLVTEIEDDTLRVRKSKNKMMMVENTREYHAMMREMDNLEKLNRMREEEKLALMEELERQDTGMSEIKTQTDAVTAELEDKRANLQARVDVAGKRLNTLDRQRKSAGKHVPPPILGRYEFIRSRLANPVIVPVTSGVCEGCHISIPPQSFIELQKGQQILSCPNCQRLIYWCNHFEAPLVEAPAAVAPVADAPVTEDAETPDPAVAESSA